MEARYITLSLFMMTTVFMHAAREIAPVTKDGMSYIPLPKNSSGCFIIKQVTQNPAGIIIVGKRYSGDASKMEKRGLGELSHVVNKAIKFDKPTIFNSSFDFRLFAVHKDPKTGDERSETDIGKIIRVSVLDKNSCERAEKEQKATHIDSYSPFFFKRGLSASDWVKIAAIIAGVGAGVAAAGYVGYSSYQEKQHLAEHEKIYTQPTELSGPIIPIRDMTPSTLDEDNWQPKRTIPSGPDRARRIQEEKEKQKKDFDDVFHNIRSMSGTSMLKDETVENLQKAFASGNLYQPAEEVMKDRAARERAMPESSG
jgi:hypothetical protein